MIIFVNNKSKRKKKSKQKPTNTNKRLTRFDIEPLLTNTIPSYKTGDQNIPSQEDGYSLPSKKSIMDPANLQKEP